jgi:hypothetical protein
MPQRQGAGAGQAVDERAAFDILDVQALGALERQRNAPRVAAGIGLLLALTGQQRRFVELVQRFRRRGGDPPDDSSIRLVATDISRPLNTL